MFRKSFNLTTLAVLLAFLIVALPTGTTSARGHAQDQQPPCPLIDAAQAHNPDFIKTLPPDCRPSYSQTSQGDTLSVAPKASGGPDSYGYTWASVPVTWIDATGGTNTGLSGSSPYVTGAIPLPFSFKYYDNIYSSVYITSYGYLSVQNNSTWLNQGHIPNTSSPNNVIAPYWTPTYVGAGAWVRYLSGGVTPNRYFVVGWQNVAGGPPTDTIGGDDTYQFEVILYESGNILFQYKNMSIGGGNWRCGTAGIENATGSIGLTSSAFCDLPSSITAVKFTRPAIGSFIDVSIYYWAYSWIERLYSAGITGGCATNPLRYCPEDPVTRAQMAIFLERGIHGSSFNPPVVTLTFTDTTSNFARYWIEALKNDGVTSGCAPSLYCPDASTTRAEMAIFLLRSKHGASYAPPAATGTMFTDVPSSYWAARWIEQLANEGITSGCGPNLYCPNATVTRAQMAVFLVRTFNLP